MSSVMRNSLLSPAQAAQHLLNRRQARTDLVAYAGYIEVPGRPLSDDPEAELYAPVETHLAEHHVLLLRALQEVSETPDGRLMVFMPRGAAKSTYSSVVFPSWYLGQEPGRKVLLGSYGEDLPRQHGKRTRSIINQRRYQQLFGVKLSREASAKDEFDLTNGSAYMATGMGAAVVGNRANGIVLDDPVKNIQEARSQIKRDWVWDSYLNDLRPCLIPGGFIVFVMTRWNEDDVAGRILPESWAGDSGYFDGRDGKRWRVLCLQARCETHTDPLGRKVGEYLWPEWFPLSQWQEYERQPAMWAAMCQQLPRPVEGAFFQEENLLVDGKPVPVPQRIDVVFAILDTAIKSGAGHDGTAVVYGALCRTGITYPLHILDWDYVQIQGASLEDWMPTVFANLEQLARDTKARMGSVGAFIEDKGSGTILLQQCANHEPPLPAQAIDSKLSSMGKVERALDASPYVAAGEVKITQHAYDKVVEFKGASRNHLLSQVLGFSLESKDKDHDDLTDAFCYAVALSLGNREGF